MKLSEIFTTIQGEGPNVGKPTTFIRFGGCNLRCPGWPCDTLYAVLPEYRKMWVTVTPHLVYEAVENTLPKHVCITGGEPLIQPPQELESLAQTLLWHHYTIDLFTNGTRLLPDWSISSSVTVVMDYKLEGSGEGGKFLEGNLERLDYSDEVKFVCVDRTDFREAIDVIKKWDEAAKAGVVTRPRFSFGAAYDLLDEAELGAWLIGSGQDATLNVQVHKKIGVE